MIDTSFLTGQTPTPLLSPFDVQMKRAQLQNALAANTLNQQAIDTGGIELQQRRQAVADEAKTRAAITAYYGGGQSPVNTLAAPAPSPALAPAGPASVVSDPVTGGLLPAAPAAPMATPPAPTPGPVGGGYVPTPRPASPTMQSLIQAGVPPAAAAGLLENFQKVDTNYANIEKLRNEGEKSHGDLVGAIQEQGALMAQTVLDSGMNPAVLAHQLQTFASHGPGFEADANQLIAAMRADPSQTKALLESMAGAGKGNREARASELTASATAAEKNAIAKKTTAELPGVQSNAAATVYRNAASDLGAAMSRDDYQARLARLAQTNPDLASQFPPAPTWTAGTRNTLLTSSLSGQEQVTTEEAAKRDAQTANYQRGELAIRNQEVGLAREKQNMDVGAIKRVAHDLASGVQLRLSELASLRGDQRLQIYDLAKQENPNFNPVNVDRQIKMEDYYLNGKGADHLQSFGTFLEHGGGASEAVNNIRLSSIPMINKPLNWWRSNMSGSPQYQALITSLEPVRKEFESFLLGGRALEGDDRKQAEIILSDNSSPAQIQSALKTMGHTAVSRLNEENYRYKKVSGHDLVDPFSPEAMAGAKSIGLTLPVRSSADTAGPAAAQAPAIPPGSVAVTDPAGGVHYFANQGAADQFRKLAGLR